MEKRKEHKTILWTQIHVFWMSRFIFISFPILSWNKCNYISQQCERIETRSLILTDAASEIDRNTLRCGLHARWTVRCRNATLCGGKPLRWSLMWTHTAFLMFVLHPRIFKSETVTCQGRSTRGSSCSLTLSSLLLRHVTTPWSVTNKRTSICVKPVSYS